MLPGLLALALAFLCTFEGIASSIIPETQNPVQAEIGRQQQRLTSDDPEERRDALMKLGAMHRATASHAALVGLSDASPIVRAVAAKAILSLGPDESVPALLPLTTDKDEFVRREAAYALGETHSHKATETLVGLLANDKEDGVRAAAAVALGEVGDEVSVVTLANVLSSSGNAGGAKRHEKNVFVLRAVARSLGQVRSKAGVPALIAALNNDKLVEDVRREAAAALGLIGDPAAIPALRLAANSPDPHLSRIAYESLKKIQP